MEITNNISTELQEFKKDILENGHRFNSSYSRWLNNQVDEIILLQAQEEMTYSGTYQGKFKKQTL